MDGFNTFPVILSTIVGFLLNEFWFSSAFLGNRLLFAMNITKTDLKNPTILWVVQIFGTLLIAVILEFLRFTLGLSLWYEGGFLGAVLGLMIAGPVLINDFLRIQQSFNIILIIFGQRLTQFIVMGGLLGALGS